MVAGLLIGLVMGFNVGLVYGLFVLRRARHEVRGGYLRKPW